MVGFIGPQLPTELQEGPGGLVGAQAGDSLGQKAAASPSVTVSAPQRLPALVARWTAEVEHGCGLKNLGNSCFLNSVLQCLAHIPPLANLCLADFHKQTCPLSAKRAMDGVYCAFCLLERRVYRQLQVDYQSNYGPNPRGIFNHLSEFSRTLVPGRQEDAHEFLRTLLEAVEDVCLREARGDTPPKDGKEPDTVVRQLFGGVLQSRVQCCECNRISCTEDPIFDVSLDISGCSSLEQAFAKFTRRERLEGANAYECEHCSKQPIKRLVVAEKQMLLREAPNVLVVHLKRFDGAYGKVTNNVAFEEHMSLRAFMGADSPDLVGGGAEPAYWLSGVLVHQGWSPRAGHYYAYVKGRGDRFVEANDDRVEQVSRETVLGGEAYMLFYVRNNLRQPAMVAGSDKRRMDGCLAEHLPASKRLRAGALEACGADVSAGSSVTEFELMPDSPLQSLSKAPEAPPPEPSRSLPNGALTNPRLNGTVPCLEELSKAERAGNGASNGAACTAQVALPQRAPSVPQETQSASPVVWGHDSPGLPPGKPLEVGLDSVDRPQAPPPQTAEPATRGGSGAASGVGGIREFCEMNERSVRQPVRKSALLPATNKLLSNIKRDSRRPAGGKPSINGRMALGATPHGRRMLAAQLELNEREPRGREKAVASPQPPDWMLRPPSGGAAPGAPSAGPLDAGRPARPALQRTFNRGQNRLHST